MSFETSTSGSPEFSPYHPGHEMPGGDGESFTVAEGHDSGAGTTVITPTGTSALDVVPQAYEVSDAGSTDVSDTPRETATEMPDEQHETHSEDRHIQVEHLRVGDTKYVVALFEHTDEYADDLKKALQGCNVIAIEQPGHNDGKLRRDNDTAPKAGEQLSAAINDLADKDMGSRGALLIDIHQDDPLYPIVANAQEAQLTYATGIHYLDPVAETRPLLVNAAISTAASDRVRDDILRKQLREDIPKRVGEAEVGVPLGSMHYRALEGVDPAYESAGVREKVRAWASPFGKLVDNLRDTGAVDTELLHTTLLQTYMMSCDIPANTHALERLDGDTTYRILSVINGYASADEPPEERKQSITAYLQAINDFLPTEAEVPA